MKPILFLAAVVGLFVSVGCESDHHREHAYWEHREHREHPVYRVQPGYSGAPAPVYSGHGEYHYDQ
jgi:hypothetical protein